MMKFFPFIFKNIKRNLRRTVLTILGLMVLLFAFCSILSINRGISAIFENASDDYILTVFEGTRACPLSSIVPEGYGEKIQSLPHVADVTPEIRHRTRYRSADSVAITGIDPQNFRNFKKIKIDEKDYERFKQQKNAAIVGEEVAKSYNWKVGQNIKGHDFSFTIAGIFSFPLSLYNSMILSHIDYFQEILGRKGNVTAFAVKIADQDYSNEVMNSIESLFANHPTPITAQPESNFWDRTKAQMSGMEKFMSMMALIAITVMIALTINSISMAIKERTKEIGILRTLGFRRRQILGIILFESTLISLIGGSIGCLLTYLLWINHPTIGSDIFYPPIVVTFPIIFGGLLISGLVGLIGGFVPAFGASKLKIIDALKEVE